MKPIVTCLTFNTEAEEAAYFYVSLFDNSRILEVTHYGESELKALERLPADVRPAQVGDVKSITFILNGREFMALNGGPYFRFSHGISLVIKCDTQEEIDAFWESLSKGGAVEECGWLKDKFGVSWQVVPAVLDKLMTEKDFERSQRVSTAIYGMKKIDIDKVMQA